jgi:hypothetical protein
MALILMTLMVGDRTGPPRPPGTVPAVQNGLSLGAVVAALVGLAFVAWGVVESSVLGLVVLAALACFAVAALLWWYGQRLGRFVYRGSKELRTKGILATADVLAVDDVGLAINGNPVLDLSLEVQPKNRESFDTQLRQMVPKASADAVVVGRQVKVRIAPSDRRRVMVSFTD